MRKKRLWIVLTAILVCALSGVAATACKGNNGAEAHTVTFTVEGEIYRTQSVKDGDLALEPKSPDAPAGKQFDCWTLDGEPFSFQTPITADITLAAAFADAQNLCTVKFMYNGSDPEEVYREVSVTVGTPVAPPAEEPTRAGYFFGGWLLQGEKYDFTQPVTTDLVFRAKWYTDDTRVWKVTYDTGVGLNYDQVVDRGELDVPADPRRDGYEFVDWYSDGVKFNFDSEIRGDLVLTALWRTETLRGAGTAADPYRLDEYADFDCLARKLNIARDRNDTEESWAAKVAEYGRYASAYYVMTRDVALPTSIAPIAANADYPFRGSFDAQGHTLSGLKIERTVADAPFHTIGLFGAANRAVIENLTLAGVDLVIRSENGYTGGMYAGGIVGKATACGIRRCTVDGTVRSELYNDAADYTATSFLGGVAGQLDSEAEDGVGTLALIAYAHSSVTVTGDRNSRAGGIVGVMSGMSSPTAVVNSYWDGATVTGGEYAGGIAGGLSYYNSVLNCYARGAVVGLNENAYVGGIAATIAGSDVIAYCYTDVALSAPLGRGSAAGPIAAAVAKDDFDYERSVGGAVAGCFYLRSRLPAAGVDADTVSTEGCRATAAASAALFETTLAWDPEDWAFAAAPALRADAGLAENKTYTVTLRYRDASGTDQTIEKTVARGEVIGKLDAPANFTADGKPYVFADWVYDTIYQRPYNYAMPVYGDLTLTAHYEDVSGIVGYWYSDASARFTVYFGPDGTAKWLASSLSTGTYFYTGSTTDGVPPHVCFTVNHGKGGASAAMSADGAQITFRYNMGMSDEEFTLYKASSLGIDTALVNAYAAPAGQMLYVVSDSLLYYEKDEETYRAGYGKRANAPGVYDIVFEDAARMGLVSASFTVAAGAGTTLTTEFTGGPFAETAVYSPLSTPDYTGEEFLGTYWSFSGDKYGGSYFKITFKADGSADVVNLIQDTEYSHPANYIYLPESQLIKLFYETNTTDLTWDVSGGYLYGIFNRGTMVKYAIYLTREQPRGFLIRTDGEFSRDNVVFVAGNRILMTIGGRFDFGATSDLDAAGWVDGARVRITPSDGAAQDYRIIGNKLYPIGAEEGDYADAASGKRLTIDGIGHVLVSGRQVGAYRLYDGLLVIEYDDDTLEAFDYRSAQNNGDRYTALAPEQRQGVWYESDPKTGLPIIGEQSAYKMVFDGFGHLMFYYYSDMNTYDPSDDAYLLNHSVPSAVDVLTDISCYAYFNENNNGYFTFLRDDNVLVFRYTGSSRDMLLMKKDYQGVVSAGAAFEPGFVHVWTQEGDDTQRLSIGDSNRGTWNGAQIGVAFDGTTGLLHLRKDGKDYTARLNAGVLTLTDENGAQSRWTVVTGSQPPDAYQLVANWSGTFSSSLYGPATFEIRENLSATLTSARGTVTLGPGVFRDQDDSIAWTAGAVTYEAVYNAKTRKLTLTITDSAEDVRVYTCTMETAA